METQKPTTAEQSLRGLADVQPPVFVIDGHDVSLHDSLTDAIHALEGVDVADGIYRLFDSQGRRVFLRAEGVRRGRFVVDIGTVHLDSVESTPTGATELREALVARLQSLGREDVATADLATLISAIRRL